MPVIEELDHLIRLTPQEGIRRYEDANALNDRITEWFETPEGSMADLPGLGHNLAQFKHEPLDVSLEIRVAMAITKKLPKDIDNLIIQNIALVFLEIDLCVVRIVHSLGEYQEEVTING